ncbi:MAG: Uma2 family endonuclease [Hyphomicrobium aestuarii]|nr:Uma2 family endonuclease [Hyphomicrobium aestuarii]
MTSARRLADQPVTIAEFDAIVEQAGDDSRLYELIAGVVTMMTNPTRRHETIVTNIVTSLAAPVRKRGYSMDIGGMRVQREAAGTGLDKVKPDIAVRCAPGTPEDNLLNFITDPIVIVEVLSPSTIDYDRGQKLEFYKSLPSVQHVVLVYQDQLRIEHYIRHPDSEWRSDDLVVLTQAADLLKLSAVEFEMSATEAYFGFAF